MNNEIRIKVGGPLMCGEEVNILEPNTNFSFRNRSNIGLREQISGAEYYDYRSEQFLIDLERALETSVPRTNEREFQITTGLRGMERFQQMTTTIDEYPLTPNEAFQTTGDFIGYNTTITSPLESYRMEFIDVSQQMTSNNVINRYEQHLSQEDIDSINEVREIARRRYEF